MKSRINRFWGLILVLALVVAACGGDGETTTTSGEEPVTTEGGTGGGTLASPFGRIADALDALPLGGVIALGKGTYREAVTLDVLSRNWEEPSTEDR